MKWEVNQHGDHRCELGYVGEMSVCWSDIGWRVMVFGSILKVRHDTAGDGKVKAEVTARRWLSDALAKLETK